MKAYVKRLELRAITKQSQDSHEVVVVHEAAVFMRHAVWVQTRSGVFKLEAQAADEA